MRKSKLFVEADSIVAEHMSGIGHVTLEIVRALDAYAATEKHLRVTLIVPFSKRQALSKYKFRNVRVRRLWPGQKIINYLLVRTAIPVPVDLWFGRGTYLFPNYKNWFVPFSHSITFVHDVVFRAYPETVHPKNQHYFNKNIRRWLGRTDSIVTISKTSAQEIINYYPTVAQKLQVIYLGVDTQQFYPRQQDEIAKVLQRYQLPSDYFLFVGNIEPRKNLLALLAAYEAYCKTQAQPAALVLIGGDGWQNEAIVSKIAALQTTGHAIYHPNVFVPDEDLPALYSGAQALLHLAVHEGYGLPPMQALACGTPVIASDIPVFRETLPQSHVQLVPPHNVAAITAAMTKSGRNHFAGYKGVPWKVTLQEILKLMENS